MKTLLDRFEDKVLIGDGCWEWIGSKSPAGYGVLNVRPSGGRTTLRRAHRLMYKLMVGPVPEGLVLDHLCCNKGCVRPDHLEPVEQSENIRRGEAPAALNARKTHCKRGHEFTAENTYRKPGGSTRECRTCKRASR